MVAVKLEKYYERISLDQVFGLLCSATVETCQCNMAECMKKHPLPL